MYLVYDLLSLMSVWLMTLNFSPCIFVFRYCKWSTFIASLTASLSKTLVIATLAALKPKAFAENTMLRQTLIDKAKSKAYGGAVTNEKLCAMVDQKLSPVQQPFDLILTRSL